MKLNSSLRGKIYGILQFIVVFSILVIPFIKTPNGNSLFRFDVSTLQLHAFNGVVKFSNFFNAFLGILFITFSFVFITQLLGRIWCGWLCPQSFFSIRIDKYVKWIKNTTIRKSADIFLSAVFAIILSMNWIMYFVSPYEYIDTLTGDSGKIMLTIWIVLFLFLFIDFAFVRFRWCKYLCPYSKFQVLMTDDDTLFVGMIPEKATECINCMACVRVCPTKIDPRKNPDADCIYCETCVTACNDVFEKIHKKKNPESKEKHITGVLGYVWGTHNKFNYKRPNLIITFFISLIIFIILMYNIIFNSSTLSIQYDNIVMESSNVYNVEAVLKNNSSRPIRVNLHTKPEDMAVIVPEEIRVYPGIDKKVNIKIEVKKEIKDNTIIIEAKYGDKNTEPYLSTIKLK